MKASSELVLLLTHPCSYSVELFSHFIRLVSQSAGFLHCEADLAGVIWIVHDLLVLIFPQHLDCDKHVESVVDTSSYVLLILLVLGILHILVLHLVDGSARHLLIRQRALLQDQVSNLVGEDA